MVRSPDIRAVRERVRRDRLSEDNALSEVRKNQGCPTRCSSNAAQEGRYLAIIDVVAH